MRRPLILGLLALVLLFSIGSIFDATNFSEPGYAKCYQGGTLTWSGEVAGPIVARGTLFGADTHTDITPLARFEEEDGVFTGARDAWKAGRIRVAGVCTVE